jgi:hypothetical protein
MIELGHALPGGMLLKDDKGVNETYRGIIEVGPARLSAYIKLLPDRQLVNELLASVLGRLVGLPVPRGFLVEVRRSDYPDSPQMISRGTAVAPAFAVEAIACQSAQRRLDLRSPMAVERLFRAWPHWYSAAAFDDWIANADRHPGNLLVGAPGEAWLIDHSHAFTGDKWQAVSLRPEVVTKNQLCQVMGACLNPSEKVLAMQACHAAVQRFSSVDTVQASRLSLVVTQLLPPDLDALTKFVTDRVHSVGLRVGTILGIPGLPLGSNP